MRSLLLLIFSVAIFSTGTHGQELPTKRTLNAGETLYVAIFWVDNVVKCYLTSPDGRIIEFKPNNESNKKFELLPDEEFIQCRANIHNVDKDDEGLWTLHAEYSSQATRSQSYNLTVNIPEVTTPAGDRFVEYLPTQFLNTSMGSTHDFIIPKYDMLETESCHLLTPSGIQYNMEGMEISGVEVISNSEVSCGVRIKIESETLIGDWILIFKGQRYSENIEKRLPFTVHVEEIVEASVNPVTLVEGNDLYVRLKNAIANHETCRLIGPDGNQPESKDRDTRYNDKCGYIVRNLKPENSGHWEITYGDKILYRAFIEVLVNAAPQPTEQNLEWTRDRPVQTYLGAEDAIYCKVVSPIGHVVFEGFGRCNISIDRVTLEHRGTWKISVGVSGQVLTQDGQFFVNVVEAQPKPTVTTSVVSEKPIVSLSCSVSSPSPIRACKFRDPSGRIMLAAEGVGQSRYSFHGHEVSYQSGLHTHDCGIQITDPVVSELGLWRCAMETEHETYYGFLSVLCPFAMRDPEVAAQVISEPVLTADRDFLRVEVGDSVTMSCSVQSAISYCYFRAPNGTVFNVGPNHPHDQATYVGAGLDAGECGIRFPSLGVEANRGVHDHDINMGTWSCHVGFPDANKSEQRASISLDILDLMIADIHQMGGNRTSIEALVYDDRPLEYCRFVRMDGLGFIGGSANMPAGYISTSNHAKGRCGIEIQNPSILEQHPWTIVARIRGQDVEITRVTSHSFQIPAEDDHDDDKQTITIYYRTPVVWIVVMAIGLSLILLAMLFGPKKNREWTSKRMSSVRRSFRSSFSRKAVVVENVAEKNPPIAA